MLKLGLPREAALTDDSEPVMVALFSDISLRDRSKIDVLALMEDARLKDTPRAGCGKPYESQGFSYQRCNQRLAVGHSMDARNIAGWMQGAPTCLR